MSIEPRTLTQFEPAEQESYASERDRLSALAVGYCQTNENKRLRFLCKNYYSCEGIGRPLTEQGIFLPKRSKADHDRRQQRPADMMSRLGRPFEAEPFNPYIALSDLEPAEVMNEIIRSDDEAERALRSKSRAFVAERAYRASASDVSDSVCTCVAERVSDFFFDAEGSMANSLRSANFTPQRVSAMRACN